MKTRFTFVPILFLFTLLAFNELAAQGCIAIRNMSCSTESTGLLSNPTGLLNKGEFQVLMGYRHFKSFRHFRGTEEEANRVANGTEVINHFNSFDLGLSYSLTHRISLTAVLPLTFNDRSSLYEHYGNTVPEGVDPDTRRFHTGSRGIGDIRISANYWLVDPAKYAKGNIALGLGIKAPTGKPDVEDDFHKLDSLGNDYTTRRPVDQSIQLGDGGWGVNVELQAFYQLFNKASVYLNGFYLSNPRNINNTLRNPASDPNDPFNYLSVADQYAARLGFNYMPLANLSLSAGGRIEGIPSEDLIGKSEGFRRPGYIISVEPGIVYVYKKAAFSLNVPIALFRNRVKSVSDKLATPQRHGDAAFADYLINASVSYRFGGSHEGMMQPRGDIFKDVPSNR
ncbi:MAG: transporter [Saprospiraceae bacterium]